MKWRGKPELWRGSKGEGGEGWIIRRREKGSSRIDMCIRSETTESAFLLQTCKRFCLLRHHVLIRNQKLFFFSCNLSDSFSSSRYESLWQCTTNLYPCITTFYGNRVTFFLCLGWFLYIDPAFCRFRCNQSHQTKLAFQLWLQGIGGLAGYVCNGHPCLCNIRVRYVLLLLPLHSLVPCSFFFLAADQTTMSCRVSANRKVSLARAGPWWGTSRVMTLLLLSGMDQPCNSRWKTMVSMTLQKSLVPFA